jgi:hypothetical protein
MSASFISRAPSSAGTSSSPLIVRFSKRGGSWAGTTACSDLAEAHQGLNIWTYSAL